MVIIAPARSAEMKTGRKGNGITCDFLF